MLDYRDRSADAGVPDYSLARNLGVSSRFLELLWARGYRSEEKINWYLNADCGRLVSPDKWPQVPEAAEFLARGLLAGRKVAVWGDYDVDGITSTALVLDVLSFHGFDAGWHIPDRNTEGYGLNVAGVEELRASGCDIMLTVDSGISDVEAISRARELGMDVVVSDHHLPPAQLPPANFFVNPRMLPPDLVPCPNLAGVGVAFYLMAAVNTRLAAITGRHYKLSQVLDLVALGTLADVMDLRGQNRLLVHGGLERLKNPARPGLAELKSVAKLEAGAPVTAMQVGFRLAPRINAAGRMRHARLALQLLRSRSHAEGAQLAKELDELNRTRQQTERDLLERAREQARSLRARGYTAGLVLYGKDWHPGVIGIVATRITEEFGVPCIIVCDDKNTLKGSGRSVPGFDLHECLSRCLALSPSHLRSFGGHKQAAGVRLEPGNLDGFRNDFSKMSNVSLSGCPRAPLEVDGTLGFREAGNGEFIAELARMEPLGTGNEEPLFLSNPLVVESREILSLKRPDSLKLMMRDTRDGHGLKVKAWNMAGAMGPDLVGRTVRIIFTVRAGNAIYGDAVEVTLQDWEPLS